jgi:hypothetical protein
MGGLSPLYFDGAVCDFKELPLPTEVNKLNKVYEHLKKIREVKNTSFFSYVKQNNYKSKFKRLIKTWQKFLF